MSRGNREKGTRMTTYRVWIEGEKSVVKCNNEREYNAIVEFCETFGYKIVQVEEWYVAD